jgi:hypothetical protein
MGGTAGESVLHLLVTAPGSAVGEGPSSGTTVSWARGRRAGGSRVGRLEPCDVKGEITPQASPTSEVPPVGLEPS